MKDVYLTKDFYLAAVLIATGAKLSSLERSSQKFVTFVIDISPAMAEKIIHSHWNKDLKIPTINLISAINELKTRLHSGV